MDTVLVTGTGGFVGARAAEYLSKTYDVVTFRKGTLSHATEESVSAFICDHSPRLIVHCAAISDVGDCEKDPEASYRANVLLPVWIARAAAKCSSRLVCFSSDQVYTGLDPEGVFDETMSLRPANVYGRHKLEMEQRVLDIYPGSKLLRATWMYDFAGYGLPIHSNLLMNLLSAASQGRSVRFGTRDMRGITYVRRVTELLDDVSRLPGGVYNYGSENTLSMADTAADFRDVLGLRLDIERDDGQAPRSLAFTNGKLRDLGICFDDTQQGIRRCVNDYRLKGFIC